MAVSRLLRHFIASIASRLGMIRPQPPTSGLPWQTPLQREHYIEFRISRRTLYAVIFSLILHLVLFFGFIMPTLDQGEAADQDGGQKELVVSLAQPEKKPQPEMAPPPTAAPPTPAPEPTPRKTPKRPRQPSKPAPKVITGKDKPVPQPVERPAPAPKPVQAPPRPQEPDPSQYADMSSYMNAVREYRSATDNNYAAMMENQRAQRESGSRSQSDEEKRDETIKKNLSSGASGVFRILSMSNYTSTFEFRGWINDFSTAKREVFQIEAKAGEDIQRATVRKMIELIRRHYSGDFNWESRQMGRVVTLSARMEDNAGLEDFLIKEFFGDGNDVRYLDSQRRRPPPGPPRYPVP
ncbi:hypothetical protein SAMN05192560_1876 [Methylobacillus rhizosphaerae]|uniref:Protein TonB, links inner and outer membranes n=1 Tax=Methylobacillus rhizosphaerae TaxID=551994 RepID=A0A239AEU8_9PROT|nr:hypothetical protein [Methylobacillus rhizosphaerae]SNR94177.1 hypothetical protein SAMN05192560_1876 [Methylobacillus rhizosphaerae]